LVHAPADTRMMVDTSKRPLPAAALVLATFALLVAIGLGLGVPLMLLAGAGATLVMAIFLVWGSIQSLTGNTRLTFDEALGMGAPSAEEERKQAVLRALKDLEYERSVGKISEDDYRELSERYREEAKRLLKVLDENLEPHRRRILARLEVAESEEAGSESAAPSSDPNAETKTEVEAGRDRVFCANCGTANESDARFCKACAAPLGQATVSS
jgi:hypothetical protein